MRTLWTIFLPFRMQPSSKGILFAFLSAIIFSLVSLTVRYSGSFLTVWHIMFARGIIGALALVILAKWLKMNLLGNRRSGLALIGLIGASGVACLMAALVLLPIFQALILLYLYPVVAALFSPYLTGERMSFVDWILIGLAFMGTALILYSGRGDNFQISWGHLFGLGAALGYGVSMTLVRFLSTDNNPLSPIFYINIVGTFLCILPLLLEENPLNIPFQGLIALIIIGILASLAHIAGNKALAFIPAPHVGIIGMSEALLGAIYGIVFFSEGVGWSSLVGAVLVISSAVKMNLRSATKLKLSTSK